MVPPRRRILILSAPSGRLDRMFAKLGAATARGTPGVGKLVAMAAKYGIAIASSAA
jgi:hypothetical protein